MTLYVRYIVLGEESAYGTAATTNRYFDLVGETLKRKPGLLDVRPERTIADTRQYERSRSVSGSMDLYAGWTGIGRLLKGFIGSPTTTSLGGGYYRHDFSPALKRSPVSWTVDVIRDIDTHRYTGINPDAMRVSLGLQDLHFGVSLNCMGKDESSVGSVASIAASAFEESIGIMGLLTLTLETGAVSYSAPFQSLDINMKASRKLRVSERSYTPTGIIDAQIWDASVKTKWVYDSNTDDFLDAFRTRADASVTFQIASGSYLFKFTMPTAKVKGDPPTVRGAGKGNMDISLEFTSLLNTATASPFVVRVENQQSSY